MRYTNFYIGFFSFLCFISCQNTPDHISVIKKLSDRDRIALSDFENKLLTLEEPHLDTDNVEIIRILKDGGGWGNRFGGDPFSITFYSDNNRSGYRISEKINSYYDELTDSILIRKGSITREKFLELKAQFLKTDYAHLTLTDTIGWICFDCTHFFVESQIDDHYNLVSWLNDKSGHGEETPESLYMECQKRRFWYLMLEYSNYNPEFIKSLGSSPNYKCW
jgi:hypothetical protein